MLWDLFRLVTVIEYLVAYDDRASLETYERERKRANESFETVKVNAQEEMVSIFRHEKEFIDLEHMA